MTTDHRDPALRALADDFWETLLAAEPVFATTVGDRRFDDRNEDRSAEAVADRIRSLDAFSTNRSHQDGCHSPSKWPKFLIS